MKQVSFTPEICQIDSISLPIVLETILLIHCRQRVPAENVSSGSGYFSSAWLTTKNEYYDHIALLYLKTRRCRCQSISFVCIYLYFAVVIFIDYSDMGKLMDINNDEC